MGRVYNMHVCHSTTPSGHDAMALLEQAGDDKAAQSRIRGIHATSQPRGIAINLTCV